MKIAHIFNEVKPIDSSKIYKDEFIDAQPFSIEYFKNYQYDKEYEDKSLDFDFSKKYYRALKPIEDRSIVSKYDDDKLKGLVEKLGSDLLIISGDFWGIQKFIFDGITTSKASKILRSRSAMVQLITYAIVDAVKKEFNDSEALLFGAGKFMIVAKNENKEKLEKLQKELDRYFLENFFGQNGFILSTSTTTKEKLLNQKTMESDLIALGKDNDNKKFNKFDLLNINDEDVLIDPFKEAKKDDDICEFCNKRVQSVRVDDETKACNVCANQIHLGKELTKKYYVSIYSSKEKKSKENIELIKLNDTYYYATFSDSIDNLEGEIFDISGNEYFDYPKWSLNSYVAKDESDEIKTFSEYVEKDGKLVSSGLMALKADIDLLGNTFRAFYKEDFRKFNRLSREVEFFFTDYITSLIAKRDNVYTVFAGGDDLFLIGEYKEIVALAKEIRKEFYRFSLNKTTISMGLIMFKPNTPITFVSNMADEAEKRAKKERDSIDIFGISMKFDEFLEIENDVEEITTYLKENNVETTTFYYRLIELCDKKENLEKALRSNQEFNPEDALWRSKLNYIIRRNIKKINNDSVIFKKLVNLVEKGEKSKPSIFLKIYNNRDKKKEQ